MFDHWRPRGPQDPLFYDVSVISMRHEHHRDALAVRFALCADMTSPYQTNTKLAAQLRYIKLPGAYGIIAYAPAAHSGSDPTALIRTYGAFKRHFIQVAEQGFAEEKWDYAWYTNMRVSAGNAVLREAGKSPTELGRSMKVFLRGTMPFLLTGTYREKGVTYGDFYRDNRK